MRHTLKIGWFVSVVVLLAACGGGGGNGSTGNTAPPTVPTNVSVIGDDGFNTVQWASVSGAISYNLYWSTSTGVTKSNGNKISSVALPLKHGGLVNGTPYFYVVTAVNANGESSDSAQATASPANAAGANDPLFGDQWHLKNTGQLGNDGAAGLAGEDINVEPVWNSCGTGNTCRGEGIRIAVVDDGLEISHEDLAANVATGLGHNYLTGTNDPSPTAGSGGDSYAHGTAVAGVIAARDMNDLGVRGVAPRANLVGYNLLQDSTESNEADAMTRGSPYVYVSSNSWGAPDDTGNLAPSVLAWRTAINTGLNSGRSGKGTIYVWAAGNGGAGNGGAGQIVDNSNYDGQANYRGVIAVGAVTDQGTKASYSERGANVWVSAPGGEFCGTHTISTTDNSGENGYNYSATAGTSNYTNTNYSKCFNGTSSATPVVSGVVALMLQANPNLGWRDVRVILATTARKNDFSDAEWAANGAGFRVNHKYGFGVVDADAAVTLAKTWINRGAEVMYAPPLFSVNTTIPDNDSTGVADMVTISGSNISEIESIEITFSSTDHTYSGDLEITLTNVMTGTSSTLSEVHLCDGICTAHDNWVFSSVRHLGEAADGDWTLTVKDVFTGDIGTFQSWGIKFYGT
ncbi:MAG: S8 family serine peptidase [Gammaproteobacteria bacterium]|nr:S8 family serine peptidase [Gammaproteobacteria bacterium]